MVDYVSVYLADMCELSLNFHCVGETDGRNLG